MFYRKKIKKSQSTLEYAALIAIVVGALIAMQSYVKRGLQGKMKKSADDISKEQFSAKLTNYTIITNSEVNQIENLAAGITTSNSNRTSNETEESQMQDLTQETWPS